MLVNMIRASLLIRRLQSAQYNVLYQTLIAEVLMCAPLEDVVSTTTESYRVQSCRLGPYPLMKTWAE